MYVSPRRRGSLSAGGNKNSVYYNNGDTCGRGSVCTGGVYVEAIRTVLGSIRVGP